MDKHLYQLLSVSSLLTQQVEGRPRSSDQSVCEPRWEAAAFRWTDDQDVGPGHQGGLQGS